MTIDEQIVFLAKGTAEIIPRDELRKKLEKSDRTGKPLRVKLGVDPTSPDIHLGHTVVIRKLRAFQELGHTVIFLIGDFTGLIGDPSGNSATRPQLSREEINQNAETYKQQVSKLLDPSKTELRFNSEWMDQLGSDGFIRLAAHVTVKQILERDDFSKRLDEEKPIALHELLYPLTQAYDSVALEADIELGGTDQKFNLLMGRSLQREYAQEPQVAMIMPLLVGTDGVQKMSKSLGNYIGINEPPSEIFGKVMSISDELMWKYYELLTDRTDAEISRMKTAVGVLAVNPRALKVDLAKRIITDFHTSEAAQEAEEEFDRRFRLKLLPESIPVRPTPARRWQLARLLVETDLAPSVAEARRLIEQGGVRIGGERVSMTNAEVELNVDQEIVLQVGKRRHLMILGV